MIHPNDLIYGNLVPIKLQDGDLLKLLIILWNF